MLPLVLIFQCLIYIALSQPLPKHEDLYLKFPQLMDKYGYKYEIHSDVVTEDGYILSLYRIMGKKLGTPVLLVHGTAGSAENFIVRGPNESIAYFLANHNYDVWMMNSRGTTHSRRHVNLDPYNDKRYWDFSWHEVGVYDTTATIDYILEKTNKTKVFYIGHSQGTTSYFVMTSSRPSYNSKIKLGISFGPSVYNNYTRSASLKLSAKYHKLFYDISRLLNIYYLFPSNEEVASALQELCASTVGFRTLCKYSALGAEYNFDGWENFDETIIPLILRDCPAGTSVNQLIHYAQVIETGEFKRFDYGIKKNLRRYNQTVPPTYDLTKTSAPTALFIAPHDFLNSKTALDKLVSELPNMVHYYEVPEKNFFHTDFIFGRNITNLVNKRVLRLFKKYDKIN